MMELTENCIKKNTSHKGRESKKKYLTKYNSKYQENYPWSIFSSIGEYHAFCTLCNIDISIKTVGAKGLRDHAKTTKHCLAHSVYETSKSKASETKSASILHTYTSVANSNTSTESLNSSVTLNTSIPMTIFNSNYNATAVSNSYSQAPSVAIPTLNTSSVQISDNSSYIPTLNSSVNFPNSSSNCLNLSANCLNSSVNCPNSSSNCLNSSVNCLKSSVNCLNSSENCSNLKIHSQSANPNISNMQIIVCLDTEKRRNTPEYETSLPHYVPNFKQNMIESNINESQYSSQILKGNDKNPSSKDLTCDVCHKIFETWFDLKEDLMRHIQEAKHSTLGIESGESFKRKGRLKTPVKSKGVKHSSKIPNKISPDKTSLNCSIRGTVQIQNTNSDKHNTNFYNLHNFSDNLNRNSRNLQSKSDGLTNEILKTEQNCDLGQNTLQFNENKKNCANLYQNLSQFKSNCANLDQNLSNLDQNKVEIVNENQIVDLTEPVKICLVNVKDEKDKAVEKKSRNEKRDRKNAEKELILEKTNKGDLKELIDVRKKNKNKSKENKTRLIPAKMISSLEIRKKLPKTTLKCNAKLDITKFERITEDLNKNVSNIFSKSIKHVSTKNIKQISTECSLSYFTENEISDLEIEEENSQKLSTEDTGSENAANRLQIVEENKMSNREDNCDKKLPKSKKRNKTILKCDFCMSHFSSRKELQSHIALEKHKEKSLQCEQCKKFFSSTFHLETHVKYKHTKTQSITVTCLCNLCGKILSSKSNLKIHMRIHEEEKPFSCPTCGKKFTRKANLEIHMVYHTGERKYTCETCGLSFYAVNALKRHRKLHSGEREYKCTECSATYVTLTDLKRHKLKHQSVKPFKCDLCEKEFIRAHDLKVHKRYHNKEIKHVCEFCDKEFVESGNYRRHLRRHTGEKPFVCKLCDQPFSQLQHLRSHLWVQHSTKIEEFVISTKNSSVTRKTKLLCETPPSSCPDSPPPIKIASTVPTAFQISSEVTSLPNILRNSQSVSSLILRNSNAPQCSVDSTQNIGISTQTTESVAQNTSIITQNSDIVTRNTGIITQNSGIITQNSGIVSQNTGIMTQNSGIVSQNTSSITQNSVNIAHNPTVLHNPGSVTHVSLLPGTIFGPETGQVGPHQVIGNSLNVVQLSYNVFSTAGVGVVSHYQPLFEM